MEKQQRIGSLLKRAMDIKEESKEYSNYLYMVQSTIAYVFFLADDEIKAIFNSVIKCNHCLLLLKLEIECINAELAQLTHKPLEIVGVCYN